MNDFTIEKNVPIPRKTRGVKKNYPFEKMEVGDSFALPVLGDDPNQASRNLRAALIYWGAKNKGKKFSILIVDNKTTVRVWRTA